MKKIILALLIFCVWTSAASGGMVIQKVSTDGFSYSFYFDFEDAVDSIVANEPSDLAGTNSGTTRESAQAQTGTYSYLSNGGDEHIYFTTSGDAVIDDAVGYCDFYYYPIDSTVHYYFYLAFEDGDHLIQLRMEDSNKVRCRYKDGTATAEVSSTATFNDATWNRIIYGWDAANDKVGIKINDNAWETSTSTAFVALGDITKIICGPQQGLAGNYYMDEAYIYKTAPSGW